MNESTSKEQEEQNKELSRELSKDPSKEQAKEFESKKSSNKFLITKTRDHITSVKLEVLKYAGKPGCNPFIWLKLNGFTLAEDIIKSPELFDEATINTVLTKVLNTKAEIPSFNNQIIPSAREIRKNLVG